MYCSNTQAKSNYIGEKDDGIRVIRGRIGEGEGKERGRRGEGEGKERGRRGEGEGNAMVYRGELFLIWNWISRQPS